MSLSPYSEKGRQSHVEVLSSGASIRTTKSGYPQSTYSTKRRRQPAFKSRMLTDADIQKHQPWNTTADGKRSLRVSYWIFVSFVFLGFAGAGVQLYFTYASVPRHDYCLVMEDNFDGDSIDTSIWHHEQQLGGFGNHEFQLTTDSTNNSFVEDGKLYIVPTLSSDNLGEEAIINGYTMNLTRQGICTSTNAKDCVTFSNSSLTNTSILPPVQSARLTTRLSHSIRYGRVEVKARMPTGDWLWPAIWMMPRDSVYGDWPRSGEIDIVESRGNLVKKRSDETSNSVRSALHWGPDTSSDQYWLTTEVQKMFRNYFNKDEVLFGLDWDEDGMYTWSGSRANTIWAYKFKKPFWDLGTFPRTTPNGTFIQSPWGNSTSAPFDQAFYLILNVAVGGTNGWFPDSAEKPWSNSAANPRADFWANKDKWLSSWPADPKVRGMSIDYVRMYSLGSCAANSNSAAGATSSSTRARRHKKRGHNIR